MAKDFVNEMLSLKEEEQMLKSKKRRIRANCRHVNKKGKPQLRPHENEEKNVLVCRDCKARVDLRPYMGDDKTEALTKLEKQVGDVVNALHIIKFRASMGGGKNSEKVIKQCADLIYGVQGVPMMLDAIIRRSNERSKHKKTKKQLILSVGASSLKFKGGSKKKGW